MTPLVPRQHYGLTLAVLIMAALAFALAQTMVVPALPGIQAELGVSQTTVTFVFTAFLLTASVATPIIGRLGDMFGKERMLVATLAVFGLGSLVAALSHSIGWLIAGRAIQGVAGAVFPLAFGIIRDEFPPEKVAQGIGLISATFGIGGGVGLVMSGVILDHLSYEWIFWIGLPMTILAAVLAYFFVPESPVRSPAKIDWGGAALLAAALVSLLIGVSEGNALGWDSAPIIGLFALAAVLAVIWVRFERRPARAHGRHGDDARPHRPQHQPHRDADRVRDVRLVHPHPAVRADPRGESATASARPSPRRACSCSPRRVVMLFAGPMAGWLGERFGSKLPLLIGTTLATSSFVFLAIEHSTHLSVYIASALLGIGVGFSFAAMANLIVGAVDQRQTGVATGINTIMRTIGGSLGGQVAASVVGGSVLASGLPAESGFTTAFVIGAVGTGAALIAAISIPAGEGSRTRIPRLAASRS